MTAGAAQDDSSPVKFTRWLRSYSAGWELTPERLFKTNRLSVAEFGIRVDIGIRVPAPASWGHRLDRRSGPAKHEIRLPRRITAMKSRFLIALPLALTLSLPAL